MYVRVKLKAKILLQSHTVGAVIVGSVDGNRIWGKEIKEMIIAGLL